MGTIEAGGFSLPLDKEPSRTFIMFIMKMVTTIFGLWALAVVAGWSQAIDQGAALLQLLAARSGAEFDQRLPAAVKAGATRQMIAEAKLVHVVKTEEMVFLKRNLAEIETAGIAFDPADSFTGLGSIEQYRGLLAYAKAIKALEDGDDDGFHEGIERGFWLFPEQGALFGRAAARYQLQQRMSQVTIDFASILLTAEAKPMTLGKIMSTGKGLVLYLWQTPSGAEELLGLKPLLAQADQLAKLQVPPVGLNVERRNSDISAKKYLERSPVGIPWLAEPSPRILARQLEFGGPPRAVVISDRGKVLFNGHPQDPALWRAVRQLAPTFMPRD